MRVIYGSQFWLCAFAAVFVVFGISQARAQSFPNRAVHIVVGVSPGGGVDNTARTLAQFLSKLWGQPVIVENRLGAAGTVAAEFVAKSAPDGYTLLVASDDITASSALRPNLPYDFLRDILPVSLVATAPAVLVVNPALPVHNIQELLALAKAQPGKLTYGSAGVGSITHLQSMRFTKMARIDMVHVPYQGTTAGVVGVVDGEISMIFANTVAEQSLTDAGKLRAIGISSAQPSPLAPSIPTITGSGVPGFSYVDWFGVFAPAGLPKDVLAALNAGIVKAASSPEMKASLAAHGEQAQPDSAEAFAAYVRADLKEKTKIAKFDNFKEQ